MALIKPSFVQPTLKGISHFLAIVITSAIFIYPSYRQYKNTKKDIGRLNGKRKFRLFSTLYNPSDLGPRTPPQQVRDQRNEKDYKKNEKKYSSDARRGYGYACKAEDGGNNRYDEKDSRPIKHVLLPSMMSSSSESSLDPQSVFGILNTASWPE